MAHSGSGIGYKRNGSLDGHHEPRLHGEIPTYYPTIIQQIAEFDELDIAHDTIDLIILDAGINDVHVTTILDPLCRPRKIEKLVALYCYQHVTMLLERLITKFKNAKIIIVGYYQMLTEQSEEGLIHVLLKALGTVPVNVIADTVIGIFQKPLKRRILENCDIFTVQVMAAFEQSAELVNRQLSHPRIFVLSAPVEAQHAALSADPWAFGINDDLSPQDPLAEIRAEACHCAEESRIKVRICDKASAGHPKAKGARAYGEALFKLIIEQISA